MATLVKIEKRENWASPFHDGAVGTFDVAVCSECGVVGATSFGIGRARGLGTRHWKKKHGREE
jgi:hypothetical protein